MASQRSVTPSMAADAAASASALVTESDPRVEGGPAGSVVSTRTGKSGTTWESLMTGKTKYMGLTKVERILGNEDRQMKNHLHQLRRVYQSLEKARPGCAEAVDVRAQIDDCEKAGLIAADQLPLLEKDAWKEPVEALLPKCSYIPASWQSAYTSRFLRDADLTAKTDFEAFAAALQPVRPCQTLSLLPRTLIMSGCYIVVGNKQAGLKLLGLC